jgi:hypothetical protein
MDNYLYYNKVRLRAESNSLDHKLFAHYFLIYQQNHMNQARQHNNICNRGEYLDFMGIDPPYLCTTLREELLGDIDQVG